MVTISGGQIAAHWPEQALVPFVSLEKVYSVMPLSSARYWPSDELVFTVSATEAGAVIMAEGVPVPVPAAALVAAGVPVMAAGVPVLAIVAALVAAEVPVAADVEAEVAAAVPVAAIVAAEVAAVVPVAAEVAAVVGELAEVAAPVAVAPVAGTAAVLVAEPPEGDAQAVRNRMPIAITPNTRHIKRGPLSRKERLNRCISFLLMHTINVYDCDNNTTLIRFSD